MLIAEIFHLLLQLGGMTGRLEPPLRESRVTKGPDRNKINDRGRPLTARRVRLAGDNGTFECYKPGVGGVGGVGGCQSD